MNLVDILARELKEWPERAVSFVQDFYGTTKWTEMPDDPYLSESSNTWIRQDGNGKLIEVSLNASDWKTAIVTREMWQAAKDKLEGKVKAPKANKDGWVRHRGGKCPVEAGALVDVRFRSGITKTVCDSLSFRWNHTGQQGDIMAYRPHVATTEQTSDAAQDVPEHMMFGHASHEAYKQHMQAIDGPLQWRDRIHAIDAEQKAADEAHKAATDARTAERAELVQKLAGEGLALLGKAGDPQHDEWKELAERENSLIPAIKAHLEAYGSSLKQALETVKAYREEIGFTVE